MYRVPHPACPKVPELWSAEVFGQTPGLNCNATISIPATRERCNGTLYRLSPIGKSSSPMQQKSPCHTHSQNTSSTTTGSAWELTQTQDPYGINNFHQDPNGKIVITTQGKPRCNYCKHPNHERQRCPFRLRDLQYNIDRRMHPQKGSLGKFTKSYVPKQNKGNRSPMSTRLANETDDSDHPRFWQTHNIFNRQSTLMLVLRHTLLRKRYMSTQTQGRDWGSISHSPPTKGPHTTNGGHSTEITSQRYNQTFKLGKQSKGTQLSTNQGRSIYTQFRRLSPMRLLWSTKSPADSMQH